MEMTKYIKIMSKSNSCPLTGTAYFFLLVLMIFPIEYVCDFLLRNMLRF